MRHYQPGKPDLQTRLDLSWEMLNPDREWGTVQRLAETYQVSRKFLYTLRDQARATLTHTLAPGTPGRPAATTTLEVGKVQKPCFCTLHFYAEQGEKCKGNLNHPSK